MANMQLFLAMIFCDACRTASIPVANVDAESCSDFRRQEQSGQVLLQAKRGSEVPKDKAVASEVAHLNEDAKRYEIALLGLQNKVSPTTMSLLQSFRVCAKCNTWERLGSPNDGGYVTCMDELENPGNVVAALSLGVSTNDDWAVDVNKKWNLPVYQFDCTVKSGPGCPDCHFFEKCIKSADGSGDQFPSKSWSLSEVFEKTNLAATPDRSILLKMDIESSEWPILEKEDPALLRKFRQIAIEFHDLQDANKHEKMLRAMNKLQTAGFAVAHIHGNNWAPMAEFGEYAVPIALEAILVSDSSLQSECESHPSNFPDDAPNKADGPPLPDTKLPAL